MASALLNRKKQFLSAYVDGLINGLNGCENYESRQVYANIIHHNFATVDISSVQKSIEGMADKFKIHGLGQRGKRLLELVDKYLQSDTSQYSQLNVQWHVLLLLLKLSHNPTSLSDEELKASDTNEPTESSPMETIMWPEYLREGWEEFQPSNDNSVDDLWSSLSEGEEEELRFPCNQQSVAQDYVTELGEVPHPSRWHHPALSQSRHHLLQNVLHEGHRSEQWLKRNLQSPWWSDMSCQCRPQSGHHRAHMCEIWERCNRFDQERVSSDSLPGLETRTFSEYQVLKEVLWLLVLADMSQSSIFQINDQGQFYVTPNLSLPSTNPDSLRLALEDLCPHLTRLRTLKRFVKEVTKQETSSNPPPVTYKAYSDALFKQLHKLMKFFISIETRLNKQDCVITLVSVVAELSPSLNWLHYLHNIHTRAIADWNTEPRWLCATRLLSVLYGALVEASDQLCQEISLQLFLDSFYVYLNIIDVWLSEGRLEDWRQEFLVIKEGESLKVMPYEEEMLKSNVTPVSLLSKLVSVVSQAGRTMEIVSQLNKLSQLRNTVQKKGCLRKEFSDNVSKEILRLKSNVEPICECDSSDQAADSDSDHDTQELLTEKTAETDLELQILFSADTASMGTGTPYPSLVGNDESHLGERDYFTTVSAPQLYSQMQTSLLDNPLLCEAMKYYLPDGLPPSQQSRPPSQTAPASSIPSCCCQTLLSNSTRVVGLMSIHSVLERQLELIISRHQHASLLVKNTLCADYSLLQHLALLRTVYFMENGVLAQSFCSFLFKEFHSFSLNSSIILSVQLKLIVEEFFHGFGTHLTVQINSGNNKDPGVDVHRAIQTISLDYRVDWPISLIVTPESIESYNKVFRFLLLIKHSLWILHNLRLSDLEDSKNMLRVQRLQVMRLWMFHSTNTLHSYFISLVLRSFSTQLETTIKHAESIDEIIAGHNQFIDEIKVHCLQDRKSHIEALIVRLLRLCANLAKLWEEEPAQSVEDEELDLLEQMYVRAYHALEHSLEAFTKAADTEHSLCELYSEISHTAPEVGSLSES